MTQQQYQDLLLAWPGPWTCNARRLPGSSRETPGDSSWDELGVVAYVTRVGVEVVFVLRSASIQVCGTTWKAAKEEFFYQVKRLRDDLQRILDSDKEGEA